MCRVLITPVAASGVKPFILEGELSWKDFPEDMGGRIYYIAGRSFPASIVTIMK